MTELNPIVFSGWFTNRFSFKDADNNLRYLALHGGRMNE